MSKQVKRQGSHRCRRIRETVREALNKKVASYLLSFVSGRVVLITAHTGSKLTVGMTL